MYISVFLCYSLFRFIENYEVIWTKIEGRTQMQINTLLRDLKLTILNVDHVRCQSDWHFHRVCSPFSRLYLVTDGYATVDHHDRQFCLGAGTLHLIPAFTTHDCHCPEWFDVYFVHFTCELDEGVDLFTMQEYDYLLDAEKWDITLFGRLCEINQHKKLTTRDPHLPANKSIFIDDRRDQSSSACDFLQSQGLLRMLLARFLDTVKDKPLQQNLQEMSRFKEVMQYIDANLDEQITLSDLSQILYLENGYFSNLFYKVMGVRPIEYTNKKRIERAQRLLLTTDDTLDNIARRTGFGNWTYLSRVFKKYVGVTPGKYRKQPHVLFK